MRKTLLVLTLAIVTLIASASDAFAQRRGGGRGGYGGGRSGVSIGIGTGYYYGNYGYYPYRSGYYYNSPYYYGSSYYYADPVVQVPTTIVRDSFYPVPAASQQTATVMVLVPTANTQIWFDNSPTAQQGMERTFITSPLASGGTYSYMVRARWTENGQTVERERQVNVQPGQAVTVNFRGSSAETLPLPKR